MYVLVDRQQMAITHKHREQQVLRDLSWIECTNAGLILPLGRIEHWMREFTQTELRLIYKNATGVEIQGYGNALGSVVNQMALRLPETDAVAEEVAAQRLCIMDGDKCSYSYCKGSKTPTSYPGLFEPDPLICTRSEAEEALAEASKPAHIQSFPVSNSTANPFAHTAAAPRAPSAPRAGGTREIVFTVADEMWQQAGSPRDMKQILDLRKKMMDVLEAQHSVKRTTASTTLGDWQKSRLA